MRQAGILAAAGIVALEAMTVRLAEDHARAKKLADGLGQVPGLVAKRPDTNMVFVALDASIPYSAEEVRARLKERGVLLGVTGAREFRLVLHYWIDDAGVERAITAFGAAVKPV
jgi:threonine aldolase